MKDQELSVPAGYQAAGTLQEKVLFALSATGEGPAEAVVRKIEKLDPGAANKEVIAVTHRILTELHTSGLIRGVEREGVIYYSLIKN